MDKIQYAKDMQKWEDLIKLGEKDLPEKMIDWFVVVFLMCGIILMALGTITILVLAVSAVL